MLVFRSSDINERQTLEGIKAITEKKQKFNNLIYGRNWNWKSVLRSIYNRMGMWELIFLENNIRTLMIVEGNSNIIINVDLNE